MKAVFDLDLDALADAEDTAEFRRGLAVIGEDHRRILMILIPKLVALQERGDSVAAAELIAQVHGLVAGRDPPLH